jgi:CRISPR-associated protein Cas5d
MKVERVSYDVPTPSAVRGILEAIYWKPAIRWIVDKVTVLNEIRFENIRRNEVNGKIVPMRKLDYGAAEDRARTQRASLVLRDVRYIVNAHFDLTSKATKDDTPGKHLDIFNRRLSRGQCFHQPSLGCREFVAEFKERGSENEVVHDTLRGERDLGWMLYDIDFMNNMEALFFRPKMVDGVIEIKAPKSIDEHS